MADIGADAFAQAEDFAVGVKLTRISFTPLMKLERSRRGSAASSIPPENQACEGATARSMTRTMRTVVLGQPAPGP